MSEKRSREEEAGAAPASKAPRSEANGPTASGDAPRASGQAAAAGPTPLPISHPFQARFRAPELDAGQYHVLDEARSDEEGGGEEEEVSDVDDDELMALLEADLPEKFQGTRRVKPQGQREDDDANFEERDKVVLVEKGRNPVEPLPEGWVQVTHTCGMPVFLQRQTRVVSMTRPYFLGPGSLRKHDIPLYSIPCLQYQRELQRERAGPAPDSSSSAARCPVAHPPAASDGSTPPEASADATPPPQGAATPPPQASADATPPPQGDAAVTPPPQGAADATPPPQGAADASPPPEVAAAVTPPPQGDAAPPPQASADATPPPQGDATPPPQGAADATPPPEGAADASPPPEGDADASPPLEGDAAVTPPPQGDATPPPEGDAAVTPPPQGDATPPPEGDAAVTPPPQGDATPPPEGDVTPPPQGTTDGSQADSPSAAAVTSTSITPPPAPAAPAAAAVAAVSGATPQSQGGSAPADAGGVSQPPGAGAPATNGQGPVSVEGTSVVVKDPSLTPQEVNEYCSSRFHFKTIRLMKFGTWRERRMFLRKKRNQRPQMSSDTKLLSFPVRPGRSSTGAEPGNSRPREWVLNPGGKSYVCILHEYLQHVLHEQPVYTYAELESAATPYGATVSVQGVQYGSGCGSGKKQAKSEAAKATLQIFIPNLMDEIDGDKAALGRTKPADMDLSFFDSIRLEDPRVNDLCNKAAEPSPYTILLICLQRNFGMTNGQVTCKLHTNKHQHNEFEMTVGKHTARVPCKNKKDGKHLAAQSLLQQLHPHLTSWGSLLRMYGNHSSKSLRLKRQDEQQVTRLQSKATVNSPNYAILQKLRDEMQKLQQTQVKPIGLLHLSEAAAQLQTSADFEPGPSQSGVTLDIVDL